MRGKLFKRNLIFHLLRGDNLLQDSDSDFETVDLLDPSSSDTVVGRLSFSCFVEVCWVRVLFWWFTISTMYCMMNTSSLCRIRKKLRKGSQDVCYLLWFVLHSCLSSLWMIPIQLLCLVRCSTSFFVLQYFVLLIGEYHNSNMRRVPCLSYQV